MARPRALAAMRVLGPGTAAGGAGSRRISPGWWSAVRWCAGLTPAFERLDDDHVSTAGWARQTGIERLSRHVRPILTLNAPLVLAVTVDSRVGRPHRIRRGPIPRAGR